jgi:AMME syndrome candidate gene 1 protein
VEAIDSLLRKGGFRGTVTEATRRAVVLTRYQAVVAAATHAQYLQYRAAAGS